MHRVDLNLHKHSPLIRERPACINRFLQALEEERAEMLARAATATGEALIEARLNLICIERRLRWFRGRALAKPVSKTEPAKRSRAKRIINSRLKLTIIEQERELSPIRMKATTYKAEKE